MVVWGATSTLVKARMLVKHLRCCQARWRLMRGVLSVKPCFRREFD